MSDQTPSVTLLIYGDINEDGLLDAGEASTTTPADTDGDLMPDYRDIDSNNDGINDIDDAGNGSFDGDSDGMVDAVIDTDGDGVPDVIDGDPAAFGPRCGRQPGGRGTVYGVAPCV